MELRISGTAVGAGEAHRDLGGNARGCEEPTSQWGRHPSKRAEARRCLGDRELLTRPLCSRQTSWHMAPPLRVIWYTDPHNVWCWGCEPMMRRLEVVYPDAVDVSVRMGGLFEDFTPVREQWARMSGGQWTASVIAFFEAVA